MQITPHYKRDHTPQMFDASACRTYTLAQYHFHWAGEDGQGSEHTIDGQRLVGWVSKGTIYMEELVGETRYCVPACTRKDIQHLLLRD